MLEYFGYQKYKKYKQGKEDDKGKQPATPTEAVASSSKTTSPVEVVTKPRPSEAPVLDADDESFFARLTSGQISVDELNDDADEGSRPPLPPRIKTPDLTWDSDAESFTARKPKEQEKDVKKEPNVAEKLGRRISVLVRRPKKDVKPTNLVVPEPEADKEQDDLSRVLDDLNLSAKNNRAFSLSTESSELMGKFTVVLKDLVNGVPTAADDLKNLLEDKDGTISKSFESLPKSLKKLVTQLPEKMTSSLAPELMLAAAESQGLKHGDNSKGGLKSTAKSLLLPKNLQELVTKPGAVVGMLKAIVNALKLRWPAFVGANVIWSIALFLLLYVLWYCHKRGREVRLEKEKSGEASPLAEDLADGPISPVSVTVTDSSIAPQASGSRSGQAEVSASLPPPPVGAGATK